LLAASSVGLSAPFIARASQASTLSYDVVVYGGTMSGIVAAYAAAREGLHVALVLGSSPLGGMPANGLSKADLQSPGRAGGLALQFYKMLGQYYGTTYAFNYEPKVALQIAQQLLSASGANVYTSRLGHVDKNSAGNITAMRLIDDSVLYAGYWIDSSYEGDLIAAAGVTYVVGRESGSVYDESLAGFGVGEITHSFSPYDKAGRLLPLISTAPALSVGEGDLGVMAYAWRLCLSNASDRLPFPQPPAYHPAWYALRLEMTSSTDVFSPGGALPNNKFDLNDNGTLMDMDYVGKSHKYPTGSITTRNQIIVDHYNYQAGLLYFLANDSSVPASYRASVSEYGLASDEFVDNAGWPKQLYVREARRLVGNYVLRQSDVQTGAKQPDSIGVGWYAFDSHHVNRFATGRRSTTVEGKFAEIPASAKAYLPFEIPYRSITPLRADATNLLVSVCASASRIAYCSLRLEHQYMIMGEAAGVAAALALKTRSPVQEVDTSSLAAKLLGYGAVLTA
jgi:hypothetical protein